MRSIFFNILLSISSLIFKLFSSVIIYIVFARILSLDDYGLLIFGITFSGIMTVISEFGFSLMAQKDIPQNLFSFNKYVFNVLIQKFFFSSISIIIGILYLLFIVSSSNYHVGLIFLFNSLISSFVMYFISIFKATNNFNFELKSSFFYFILILILLIINYFYKLNVNSIAIGFLIARIFQLLIIIIDYYKKFKFSNFIYDKKIQKYLFYNSYSYGLFYIFGVLYFMIDTQLLSIYSGNVSLGIYQSMINFATIFLMIIEVFSSVFVQNLSSVYKNNYEFIFRVKLFNKFLIFFGLIFFMFFYFFTPYLFPIIYGNKFDPALEILFPISLIIFIRFYLLIYSLILTISKNQKYRLISVIILLIFNFSINLYVIPSFSFNGAAYVNLMTHFFMVILYSIFIFKTFTSLFLDYRCLFMILTTLILTYLSFNFFKLTLLNSLLIFILHFFILFIIYSKKDFLKTINLFFIKYKSV